MEAPLADAGEVIKPDDPVWRVEPARAPRSIMPI